MSKSNPETHSSQLNLDSIPSGLIEISGLSPERAKYVLSFLYDRMTEKAFSAVSLAQTLSSLKRHGKPIMTVETAELFVSFARSAYSVTREAANPVTTHDQTPPDCAQTTFIVGDPKLDPQRTSPNRPPSPDRHPYWVPYVVGTVALVMFSAGVMMKIQPTPNTSPNQPALSAPSQTPTDTPTPMPTPTETPKPTLNSSDFQFMGQEVLTVLPGETDFVNAYTRYNLQKSGRKASQLTKLEIDAITKYGEQLSDQYLLSCSTTGSGAYFVDVVRNKETGETIWLISQQHDCSGPLKAQAANDRKTAAAETAAP